MLLLVMPQTSVCALLEIKIEISEKWISLITD